MANNLLEVRNVSKAFTGHVALDNVSLEVPVGSIYGLLGPNGAGKTTLIRIINHITAPDSGEVLFDGHRLVQDDVAHIGYLPEERGLYKKMKVGEQALFFARLKGLSKAEATRELHEWFERFDIASWWNRKIEELSKGMAQKVQFIVTVLHRPKLLILDEPFSGFDPINANLLKEEILRLRDEGATIIFSTHNMSSVEDLCDDITLINNSHDILSGNVEEIRRNYCHGRYSLRYTGDTSALKAALEPLVSEALLLPPGTSGLPEEVNQLDLMLRDEASLRDVINVANNAVELRAINEALGSMNDIFIHTVQAYNATHGIQETFKQ
ncbi:MAG: ATP-binding cassette domain-containing protein [Paramuribaculum sp.]|nr:ATP-binding cassette domain-containing protein [Paramuribaculum sp.]